MSIRLHRWQRACAVVIIIAVSAIAMTSAGRPAMEITSVTQASGAKPSRTAAPAGTAAAGAQIAGSSQTRGPVVNAPQCSRDNAYQSPSPLAASIDQPGFHQAVQPIHRYTVYGNDVAETNRQIAACTPVNEADGRFAASTDYVINWVISYRTRADGLCYIDRAAVSLNTAQVYPDWQAVSGSSPAMAAAWQKFIASLTAHENGHLKLDQAAAGQLYNDLINLPATDCGQIAAAASAKSRADMAALNQANADYDALTDHGSTQGAVLGL